MLVVPSPLQPDFCFVNYLSKVMCEYIIGIDMCQEAFVDNMKIWLKLDIFF